MSRPPGEQVEAAPTFPGQPSLRNSSCSHFTGAILKGQGRRILAVYPTARPANWPGRQYTNLAGLPQAVEAFLSMGFGQSITGLTVPLHDASLRMRRQKARPTKTAREDGPGARSYPNPAGSYWAATRAKDRSTQTAWSTVLCFATCALHGPGRPSTNIDDKGHAGPPGQTLPGRAKRMRQLPYAPRDRPEHARAFYRPPHTHCAPRHSLSRLNPTRDDSGGQQASLI